jgi:hypothetical protein
MKSLKSRLVAVSRRYSEQQPLAGYAGAVTVFAGAAAAVAGVALVTGRRVPRVSAGDVVLMAAATHKLSRLIAKDAVTSPLRAPFTRFDGPAGDSEVNELVIGEGAAHTVGELLTCPFCLSVWIAGFLCAGLTFAPRMTRMTRLGAAGLAAVAGADFLHLAYDGAKKATGNAPDESSRPSASDA